MSEFQGFPARTDYTPVPNAFFSVLLPQIEDAAELKVTLHVIAEIYRKKGYPRFVSFNELLGNTALVSGLKAAGEKVADTLRGAIDKAVARGSLLGLTAKDGAAENIYFLNDEAGRQAATKMAGGAFKPGVLKAGAAAAAPAEELPDIFTLYEQNIGMLTPMVADELREIEKLYPPDWVRDAVREAVLHNKRNIRYISKILENWSVEGRSDGTYQRDSQKAGPDKYFKGKYGHMVQR